MNLESFGARVKTGQWNFANQESPGPARAARRRRALGGRLAILLFIGVEIGPGLLAQPAAAPADVVSGTNAATSPEAQLAALLLERTNAWQRVLQIVNRPVTAYVETPELEASVYSPGWFHPGAIKPNFNTVDVRQSQELAYAKSQYVTSDLNPGVVFRGQDLEFNSMTKYFYLNRSLPKRRLTEAEMVGINQLYRIIGHCEHEISQLQAPPDAANDQVATEATDTTPAEAGFLARIQRIPQSTRLLYGGIAIGGLLLIMGVARLLKNQAE
jgi:hypothetical protein